MLADYVWVHMAGLFGHRWTSAYGDDPRGVAGREWALTLAGLSRDQVDRGLDACRNSGDEWPPTAPVFKARCMGVPSFEQLRREIHGEVPGSAFAHEVWLRLDVFRWRAATADRSDQLLRHAYDTTRDLVLYGELVPTLPAAAIAKDRRKPQPASPAVALAAIGECRAMLEPKACEEALPEEGSHAPE